MKSAARVLFPALLVTLVLAGCEAPANVPRAASHRSAVPQQSNWTERREAQLTQMGLDKKAARNKAQEEAARLGLASTETYSLYDSAAKQRAMQEDFENDLAKTARR